MANVREIMIRAAKRAAQDAETRNSDNIREMWDAYWAYAERGTMPKKEIWERWLTHRDAAEKTC